MPGAGTPLPPPAPTDRPFESDLNPQQELGHGSANSVSVDVDAFEPAAPLPGSLTGGWRLIMIIAAVGAVLSWSAVWSASVQLGLSTWWLGPRADPTALPIRLAPYVLPIVVVIGALNGRRWLTWLGLAAAAVFAGYGIGDLGRVPRLAALELVVAGAVAVVSLASLTGVYRHARTDR